LLSLLCQVLRWQDTKPCTRAAKRARRNSSSNNGSSAEQAKRDTLELELQDASEQHAALAVLQSLYAVKPLPELLSELSQEQQLQAAVLADKWQVPLVSSAAADILAEAASTGVLEQAVQQHMLSAQALPECLQPLLKRVLLSLLGDLEAVWTDAGLQEQLLQLPLHSMELLLSCDELKVLTSERTQLFNSLNPFLITAAAGPAVPGLHAPWWCCSTMHTSNHNCQPCQKRLAQPRFHQEQPYCNIPYPL
jgi:hypothetical protein